MTIIGQYESFSDLSSVSTSGATITWTSASDDQTSQQGLEYLICSGSTASSVSSVETCELATIVQDYKKGISSFTVTNQPAQTTRYYNVLVRDGAGNKSVFAPITVTTTSGAPGAFTIRDPVENSISWNTLPIVQWSQSAGAEAYNIQVASDASCSTVIESSSNQTGLTYRVINTMVESAEDCGNGNEWPHCE